MLGTRIKNILITVSAYKKYGHMLLAYDHEILRSLNCADDQALFIYTSLLSNFIHDPIIAAKYFILGCNFFSFIGIGLGLIILAKNFIDYAIIVTGLFLIIRCVYVNCWIDVYIAYILPFTMIIPLLIAVEKKKKKHFLWIFFFAGLLGGFSDTLRIFSFLPVLAFFIIILIFNSLYRHFKKCIPLVLLCLGYIAPHGFLEYQKHKRDLFLLQYDKSYDAKSVRKNHGFWHNMYLGFSFLPNEYGIIWSDDLGLKHAQKIDETLTISNNNYEPTVCKLVFNLFIHDFRFVLKTFFAKLGIIFYFFLVYCGFFGLIAAWLVPKRWYVDLAFLVCGGLSVLPGLLTIPWVAYLLGFVTCIVLYTIYSVLYALHNDGVRIFKEKMRSLFYVIKNTE